MKVLFFDVETTGLDISKDRIIQIAMQGVHEDSIKGPLVQLFNPGIPISPDATAVHGITDEVVRKCPRFSEHAPAIHAALMKADVIAGYNIKNFDIPILAEEMARCGFDWPPHDVKIIDSYNTWIKRSTRKLPDAYSTFTGKSVDPDRLHNAAYDVHITAETTHAMMGYYGIGHDEMIADSTTGHLVDPAGKIGMDERGEYVYLFGKNTGKPVTSDVGYAQWMLKGEFPEVTKRVLRQILGLVQ